MPYESKEDYNNYLRNYMRERRSVKPNLLNPVKPSHQERLEKARLVLEESKAKVEHYNPDKRYSPGDKVLVQYGRNKKPIETIVPELDGDGQPIPSYD